MSLAILNDHKPRPEKIYVDLMQIEGGPKAGTTSVARKIDEHESTVLLDLPVAGEYALKLVAVSEKIGGEGAKLEWKFNGQLLRTTELAGRRDAKDTLKATVRVDKAGKIPLTLRVANPLPNAETKNGQSEARTLTVREIMLTSPPQPVQAPPSQYRLFAPGRGQPNLEASARVILASFGQRAFRRPLVPAEVDRFFWIRQAGGKEGCEFRASGADGADRHSRLSVFYLPW